MPGRVVLHGKEAQGQARDPPQPAQGLDDGPLARRRREGAIGDRIGAAGAVGPGGRDQVRALELLDLDDQQAHLGPRSRRRRQQAGDHRPVGPALVRDAGQPPSVDVDIRPPVGLEVPHPGRAQVHLHHHAAGTGLQNPHRVARP